MLTMPGIQAVFFDVDGTLVTGPSVEFQFVMERWRRGKISCGSLAAGGLGWLGARLFRPGEGLREKRHWRGSAAAEMEAEATEFVGRVILKRIRPSVAARLEAHQNAGHPCFLLTGTLECLARPLGEALGVKESFSTRLETAGGNCTGRILGRLPYGPGKREILEEVCRQKGFEQRACAAYADLLYDIPLLEAVGFPVVVAPSRRMRKIAGHRGWEILG